MTWLDDMFQEAISMVESLLDPLLRLLEKCFNKGWIFYVGFAVVIVAVAIWVLVMIKFIWA